MKKHFGIYFFIFITLLLIVLLLLWRRPIQNKMESISSQNNLQSTNAPVNVLKMNSNAAPIAESIVSAPAKPVQNDLEKTNAIRQYMESQNKPINFYGQIIDQDGNPVSGVKVKVEIRHIKVIVPAAWGDEDQNIPVEKETDLNGRIEIQGVTGDGFQVESVQKTGYQLSPKASNHYAPGSGSFENPAIIKMWKEGIKEPLIGGSHVFGIDSGKTYILDLINGKKIEGEADGDLRVVIIRPSSVQPRDKFTWFFSIEAIGGGLVEADPDDEFMYFAPESGYEPKIEMQFDPNDSTWTGTVKKQFFIRSRNGQVYGRADVEVHSIYNVHSAIEINYTVNANASRNLQP